MCITSCGLNGGPLKASGEYPAVIACILTNGRMPHGSNSIYKESFPNVNNDENDRFISEICDNTLIGYRYFEFDKTGKISLVARAYDNDSPKGRIDVSVTDSADRTTVLGSIDICAGREWKNFNCEFGEVSGVYTLHFIYHGIGRIDIKNIVFL